MALHLISNSENKLRSFNNPGSVNTNNIIIENVYLLRAYPLLQFYYHSIFRDIVRNNPLALDPAN